MPMSLNPEELAARELRLSGRSALRLAAVVAVPLALALAFEHPVIVVGCLVVAGLLFFPLLKGWGYTTMAIYMALVPLYAALDYESAPIWLVGLAGVAALGQFAYVRHRLRQIHLLRQEMGLSRDRGNRVLTGS
jgi:hypothetical protein